MARTKPRTIADFDALPGAVLKVIERHFREQGCGANKKGDEAKIRERDKLRDEINGALLASKEYFDPLGALHRDLFERATAFVVGVDPKSFGEICIKRKPQKTGPDLWAVTCLQTNLNKKGEWIPEPDKSKRDEQFKADCRWETREDAFRFWRAFHLGTLDDLVKPDIPTTQSEMFDSSKDNRV